VATAAETRLTHLARILRFTLSLAAPVIALSAHALAGEREKALAAGCNEFDTKPIEFDRLVATVRRILANRK
jgi:CheY-like chemotaxis protein